MPARQNVYHLFPILCQRRDELRDYLARHGVGTVIHYPIPPHKQECYRQWNNRSLPVTEHIARHELSLPISPAMTAKEAQTVISLMNAFDNH